MTRPCALLVGALTIAAGCSPPPTAPNDVTGLDAVDAAALDAAGLDARASGVDVHIVPHDVPRNFDVMHFDAGQGPTVPQVTGPSRLSETGLYADFAARTLAPGVIEYRPRYELWSDGATKRRFLLLPPGGQIDTSDMDHWVFPVGTRVWKEFRVDGLAVETRLLEKMMPGPQGWWEIAYLWTDSESDALAAPDGVTGARGTPHAVPSQSDCVQCHANVRDVLIGVSAIQLAGSTAPGSLSDLAARGLLSSPPTREPVVPGDATVSAALGYLHGNCGHCHNDGSYFHDASVLRLRLSVRDVVASDSPAYRTAINVPMFHLIEGTQLGVVPGAPAQSQLYVRMGLRDGNAMPPYCTLVADPTGLATIRDWILALR